MKTRVKICGMKFPENITEIATLQPDYLGFIFFPNSPRNFENKIPTIDKSIRKVGVFVNASFNEIEEKTVQHQLDLVQLHGEESPEFCLNIETNIVKVIKSFAIDNSFNFKNLESYIKSCTYFLFDTKGSQYGGNGKTFEWNLLSQYHLKKPYFLSGGIHPKSHEDLHQFFQTKAAKHCYGIDLNSCFETQPGLKQQQTLNFFLHKLKSL